MKKLNSLIFFTGILTFLVSCQMQEQSPKEEQSAKEELSKEQILNLVAGFGKMWQPEAVFMMVNQDTVDITKTDPGSILFKEILDNGFFQFLD